MLGRHPTTSDHECGGTSRGCVSDRINLLTCRLSPEISTSGVVVEVGGFSVVVRQRYPRAEGEGAVAALVAAVEVAVRRW